MGPAEPEGWQEKKLHEVYFSANTGLDMEIRELRQEELERLVNSCWKPFAEEMAALDEYNALVEDACDDQLTYWNEQFEDTNAVTFVVENDGFIGYIVAERQDTPPVFQRGEEVHITELYVKDAYRDQGIASALMDQAEHWAVEHSAERVKLTVNRANESAQSLYRDRGYVVRLYTMDKTL